MGLDERGATDIVVLPFGHDVYRSLVGEAGWSVAESKAWLLTTLARQLSKVPS